MPTSENGRIWCREYRSEIISSQLQPRLARATKTPKQILLPETSFCDDEEDGVRFDNVDEVDEADCNGTEVDFASVT